MIYPLTVVVFRMEARKLAGLFVKNFVRFENGVNDKVKAAGPKV